MSACVSSFCNDILRVSSWVNQQPYKDTPQSTSPVSLDMIGWASQVVIIYYHLLFNKVDL